MTRLLVALIIIAAVLFLFNSAFPMNAGAAAPAGAGPAPGPGASGGAFAP